MRALILALVLSGCAELQAAQQQGASVMDAYVAGAEWSLCYAASIGSIRRKYGQSQSLADAYNTLCASATLSVIQPKAPE